MAELVLGPVLRYVGETEATVWLETDSPCEVEVLGRRIRTFAVEGHHYAIVVIQGLDPGATHEYRVTLNGVPCWPPVDSDFPASVIRTLHREEPVRFVFGSCRVSLPHEPPYTLTKDEDDRGREIDALYSMALRMRDQPHERWPHALLLLGDQVYADEVSPATLEFIRGRRDVEQPPGEEIADFEEYTRLYLEAWSDPNLRWLLSTVSTAMIFDDHDVHDDWNTSIDWLEAQRAKPWWDERIVGGLMSYWIYQHLGNLSPTELKNNGLLARVRRAPDGGPMLREYAYRADREVQGSRWTYYRDLGRTRLVVMDSRAGRILDNGRRCMVDDDEWRYIEDCATGDFDHLLLASTLPILLAPGMHHMEAWNEAVCAGAWGGAAAKLGEKLRQGLDLEHWAAFGESFERMAGLLREVGAGDRGRAPASIVALSGDVHHAYLADVAFRRGSGVESAVYQAVCSPIRNPLDSRERRFIQAAASGPTAMVARRLARAAGVADPDIRWRITQKPTFDNQVATLELDGRGASLRIERSGVNADGHPVLETALERQLA